MADNNNGTESISGAKSRKQAYLWAIFGFVFVWVLIIGGSAYMQTTVDEYEMKNDTIIDADDGPRVELGTNMTIDRRYPIPGDGSVDLGPDVRFVGQNGTKLRYDGLQDDGFLQLENMELNGNTTVENGTIGNVTLDGSVDGWQYKDIDSTDNQTDLRYRDGSANVTMEHDRTAIVVNNDTGEGVDQAIHSNGEITFNLEDEGGGWTNISLVEPDPPEFDDSSAKPTGAQSTQPNELQINVSSPDGINMDVEFFLDGTSVGNDTVEGGGTANVSVGPDGGAHDWHAVATDGADQTTTSSTYSFNSPDTLHLRNETDTSELIDSPVDVEVRFFTSDEIVSRSASNGTVDLSGLPIDEGFVVEADANQDYHSRTVYIDDIHTQQNVFMLSKNVSSVESRFELEDPTGQYDAQSVLYVQKPVDFNGSVQYQTVYADQLGSEGVTANLEEGSRYNLRIESESGVSQDIGPYRADITETVTVRPGSPTISVDSYEDGWGGTAEIIEPAEGDYKIEYVYEDPDDLTDSVDVSVTEKGNQSNQLGANQTHTDLGEASGMYNLTANESEKTWVVNFDVDRDGEQYRTFEEVSIMRDLTGDLSDGWRLIIAIGILLVSAGVFSRLNSGVGGVVVSIEAGVLYWTGWLSGATTVAGVMIALFVSVIVHIYRTSGP